MRRSLVVAACVAALALLASAGRVVRGTDASSAAFTTTSSSTISATAARVSGWLHLSSQGSETGYADQVGNASPAASGEDEDIVVDFVIAGGGTYNHAKVLKVWTPTEFPDLSPDPTPTSVTVTVTATPDPTTGLQPISKYGVDVWDAAPPTYTKTITGWSFGTERQLNLQTKFPGKKFAAGLYQPSIVLTLTYTGFTTTYYQYTIPIRIQYQ